MKKALIVLAAIASMAAFADAKKMYFVNIDKGEIPSDSFGCTLSLSEEHGSTKGGMALLVESTADETKGESLFFGECPPRKGVWDGYDFLRFDVFNPGNKVLPMALVIKPVPNVYEKRIDFNFMCRPGKSSIEYELNGAATNDGSVFDWKKKMGQWSWCAGQGVTKGTKFYVSNIRLETADEGEKEEKKDEKKK
jgi:hypothetical protein